MNLVTEATEEAKGLKRRTCTKCGKVEEKETIKLVIGATIDYKEYIDPSTGTAFETMPSYTSLKTTRGTTEQSDDSDTTYTIAEPEGGETGIEWIVIGEEDGKIKIKTKNIVQPSSGGYTSGNFKYLRFYGQAGYANFVNELNSIGAIYGKGKYAESGRSMKMEDLGYGVEREASYIYAKHSDGKIYRYAATATAEDIANETSTTGGSESTFRYMAMDGDSTLKEGDEGAYEWKSLSNAGDNVTMYQYKYTGSQTVPTSVAKADTRYWLASRYLGYNTSLVNFYARYVDTVGNDDTGNALCNSLGSPGSGYYGVCPVVYLQSDIQLEYDSATNSYTISE